MSSTPSFVWSFLTAALIIGITSGLGKSKKSWLKRILGMVIVGLIAGLSAGTVDFLIQRAMAQRSEAKHVDATLQAAAQMPLLNVILKDNPSDATELRQASRIDHVNGTIPTQARAAAVTIIQKRFPETVFGASDVLVLDAWKAKLELIEHLGKSDLKMCRELASIGIQDESKLDAEGTRYFLQAMRSLENIYAEGKSSTNRQEELNETGIKESIKTLELSPETARVLLSMDAHSEQEVCDAASTVYRRILSKASDPKYLQLMRLMLAKA